jgi:hypothetical protein
MESSNPELQGLVTRQRTLIEQPFLLWFSEPLLEADTSVETKITRVRDETTDDD